MRAALSLLNAAGMLPVLIAVVYILAYRNNVDSVFYRIFSFILAKGKNILKKY